MEYDFMVGFTLFTPKGFKTMYRHFDKLDTAKMFTSNVNIKDNSKIYVDLKYLEDKLKEVLEKIKYASDTSSPDLIKVKNELINIMKEVGDKNV